MHFENYSHSNLFCAAVLAAVSVGAVGCDEGPEALGELSLESDVVDDEAEVGERAGGSSTKPWEPGSGFFEIDETDPEHQVYFSTCPTFPDRGIEYVFQTEVDPADKTVQLWQIFTHIPEDVYVGAPWGGLLKEGDRVKSGNLCTYSSSYVGCPEVVATVDYTLRTPSYDALIKNVTSVQHYWDYGQDRFRVLRHNTRTCEGADCDDPYVLQLNGGAIECEAMSMTVYRRVPEPTFD